MMANCFLCGKKLGFFDSESRILENPICNSCHEKIMDNVDSILSVCKSEAEIKEKSKHIKKRMSFRYEEPQLSAITKYINETRDYFINNIREKEGKTEVSNDNNIDDFLQKIIRSHMLTTGYDFYGYEIVGYRGLVSGECVIGTGIFSDILSDISDITGSKSKSFSDKIKEIKKYALAEMIEDSIALGGNAIIGISYDHITFSGKNMIGLSVNGTSVKIVKVEKE